MLRARIRKEISTFILPDPNPLHSLKTRVKLRFASNNHLCPSWQFIRKLNSFLCFGLLGLANEGFGSVFGLTRGSSEPDRLLKVMSNENRDGSKQDADNVYAPVVIVSIWDRKRILAGQRVYQNRSIDTSFDPPQFSIDITFQRNSNTVFFLILIFYSRMWRMIRLEVVDISCLWDRAVVIADADVLSLFFRSPVEAFQDLRCGKVGHGVSWPSHSLQVGPFPVLWIRIRMFLAHQDPLVRGTDPDPAIIQQKQ